MARKVSEKGKKSPQRVFKKGNKSPQRVFKKGNKKPTTSNRPVLKTTKIHKKGNLTKDEVSLGRKILKEGLSKKGKIPAGNIALDKSNNSSFLKKNTFLRKNLEKPRKVQQPKGRPGIICLTNLPHGFFEKQLNLYFTQFGEINQVRVVRSKLTGRSCGYGYVEFKEEVVAKIAAESMHNYLTFGKIIKCRFLKYSTQRSEKFFGGEQFNRRNCPKVISRESAINSLNAARDNKQRKSRVKRVRNQLNRKLKELQSLGVNLDLEINTVKQAAIAIASDNNNSTKDSGKIKEEKESGGKDAKGQTGEVVFEADQSDDEIILKTPPFARKKLVKITPSSPALRVKDKSKASTGKVNTEEKVALDDTPKSLRMSNNSQETPKATKPRKQLAVSEKKNSLKKRKLSQVNTEGNNSKKQKRLSI